MNDVRNEKVGNAAGKDRGNEVAVAIAITKLKNDRIFAPRALMSPRYGICLVEV